MKGFLRIIKRKRPRYSRSINDQPKVLNGVIAYNKYGGYVAPVSSRHRPAVKKILRGKVHEPETVDFIRRNCGRGDVVHAGTYFGDFLPGLASALSNDALIWAFEPNRENFRCAQMTSYINDLMNVRLFNCGLGERKRTAQMLIESENGVSLGGSSHITDDQPAGNTIEVEIASMDEIIPPDRFVSIIHLDVEGYELQAFKGALNTIGRCKPILIIEDNNKAIESDWFRDNILSMGYTIKGKIHANTLLELSSRPEPADSRDT